VETETCSPDDLVAVYVTNAVRTSALTTTQPISYSRTANN
jgi:hypothetical protein